VWPQNLSPSVSHRAVWDQMPRWVPEPLCTGPVCRRHLAHIGPLPSPSSRAWPATAPFIVPCRRRAHLSTASGARPHACRGFAAESPRQPAKMPGNACQLQVFGLGNQGHLTVRRRGSPWPPPSACRMSHTLQVGRMVPPPTNGMPRRSPCASVSRRAGGVLTMARIGAPAGGGSKIGLAQSRSFLPWLPRQSAADQGWLFLLLV